MATMVAEAMGDSAARAFADFYEAWFAKVYNYARHRTGSAVRADEIVCDTFERAFKAWSRFDPAKGEASTWLFSIAFRCVADHYRSQKRSAIEDLPFEAPDRLPGPAQELEAAQEQRALMAALAELPEEQREIVTLRFFGGMTNRDIGHLLGLSESNVAVILFRSVRRMRKSFPGSEATA